MKFEINRKTMLEAAKNVAKIAPSSSPVDVLNGILIESNEETGEVYLTATNYEISIQQKVMASVKEGGAMLINARLLVGMMSMLEGEIVILSADRPELLKVIGDKCTYKINCLPSKSYPKPIMPFPEESALMTGICSLAKRTTFAVSKDESKPSLQCVQVKLKNNAVYATACDGIRMMLVKDSAEQTDEREFLLPGRALQTLAAASKDDDVFEVGDIGNEVVFVRGDMIFTIRKLDTGSYIDATAMVKKFEPIYAAVTDANKIKDALSLTEIGALSGKTKAPVNLILSDGEIILKCANDFNEISSTVAASISKDTPNTGFFYDVSALIKLFQVISGKVKLEMDAKGFMFVKTRSEVYLQAPMSAPAKVARSKDQDKQSNRAKGAEDVKDIA